MRLVALLLGFCLLGMASPARAEPRFALVVGNGAYQALAGLPNPGHDAEAMGAALQRAGFQVVLLRDLDQRGMRRAIADFGQRVSRAGRGSTALFFYAGHGLQYRGINYLIPVDARIRVEADIELEAVAADTVFRQMEEAGAETRILILDACRNLPIFRSTRSGQRGLAPMEAPGGSFIAYSTAPGRTAADGGGPNSPFVSALVREMGVSGLAIEEVFRNVRRAVMAETGGEQMPWDASSLLGRFEFIPGAAGPGRARPQVAVAPPRPAPVQSEPRPEPPVAGPAPARRFNIEIAIESLTETDSRYVATIRVRNFGTADSGVAVQSGGFARAELYLSDGMGGSCQMAANGEGWGTLRTYGPQNYNPAREIARSATPVPAGGTARHTVFFNKGRCDTLMSAREGLSINGTFYVPVDGEPEAFPVSFEGLTMRRATPGRR